MVDLLPRNIVSEFMDQYIYRSPYTVVLQPCPLVYMIIQTPPTQRSILLCQGYDCRLSDFRGQTIMILRQVLVLVEVLEVDIFGECSVEDRRILCFSGRTQPIQIHWVEFGRLRGRGHFGDRDR